MANLQKFAKGNVKDLSIHLDRKTTNDSNKEILMMNESERLGRLIIDSFERGLFPKDISKAQEAYSVLEENKKAGTIPVHRLERVLEVLKAFIDEFLSREDRFSLNGLKERQKGLDREETPKRNRDRGMSR